MNLTHIFDGDGAKDTVAEVCTMLCGATCILWDVPFDSPDHPDIEPPDFDFYWKGHGDENATCEACQAALCAPAEKKIVVHL